MFNIVSEILGVAGFVISLINFIYFFIIRKRKMILSFGTYGIRDYREDSQLLIIYYRFDNASQLAISITRIQIIIGKEKFDCSIRPSFAEEIKRIVSGREVYRNEILTDTLPINLGSLSSRSGFLGFVIPQDTLTKNEKALTFRICTNRGKAIQKTFALHEDVKCR